MLRHQTNYLVFFVGHTHSGYSIEGSLMNSHPHVVISDEYDLSTELSSGSIATDRITIFNNLGYSLKGCTLFVDGLYQGKYVDQIDVIGDEKEVQYFRD